MSGPDSRQARAERLIEEADRLSDVFFATSAAMYFGGNAELSVLADMAARSDQLRSEAALLNRTGDEPC